MTGATIQAPYVLASVPNPLDGDHGRIRAAPVYGLKESRKRKRHEVVVGSDGEGVNIYNIRSHKLISSYALPPQSYLCAAPCSVHESRTNAGATRSTFVAIGNGQQITKRRLLSFTEGVRNRSIEGNEFARPEKRECNLPDGELIGVEIIPYSSSEQHSVLLSYRNGSTGFITSDLSEQFWEEPPSFNGGARYEVEHATVFDFESAKKGILKEREDITARLEQDGIQTKSVSLLCRLIRSDEHRRFELYLLRDPTQSSIRTVGGAIQLLASYELPLPYESSTSNSQYELHPTSGTLYQLLDGKLNVYDLSGTLPGLATELGGNSTYINSFVRASASSVLTFSGKAATLFEISFGSVLAAINLGEDSAADPNSKKRKREDFGGIIAFTALFAFADLGLIVGLNRNQLVAFQLDGIARENEKNNSRRTLLRDVIGKGVLKDTIDPQARRRHAEKWENWMTKIDSLIAEGDIQSLELLVANDPRLGRQRKPEVPRREREDADLPNGHPTAYDELWPLPEPLDPKLIDRRKVLYILSKVFDLNDESGELEIAIGSSKLLEWLALTGFLSPWYMSRVFHHIELKPGDIMSAIKLIDDDFQLMRALLTLPVQWDFAEVVQALRFVISSLDNSNTENQLLALPAPPGPNSSVEMVNGDAADSDVEDESKAAENEIDFVMNALTTGLEIRSDMLRVITLRLHALPSDVVTSTMRSMMSHNEIIFFIHILRIELADGGWTSRYINAGDQDIQDGLVNTLGREEERGGPSDQAIRAIGDLLNCAIDAMGTSGWLIGQSSSALRSDELIDSLRTEVSAGLEGCYEASTLATLLTELERCASSEGKLGSRNEISSVKDHQRIVDQDSLLPLGSTKEPPPTLGRNGKAKKSKMAIGREKSRRVGKYSFERIRI